MNQPIKLSLEQEFSLRSFADQVEQMTREQAREFLILQHKYMMIRETMYQEILKHEWQIGQNLTSQ